MLLQLVDDEVGAVLIGRVHVPADMIGGRKGTNRLDRRLALEDDVVGLAPPNFVAVEEPGRAFAVRVAPADHRHHELTVIADRLAVNEGVIPDEAGGRIREGVAIVLVHAVGIASGEPGVIFSYSRWKRPWCSTGAPRR